MLRTRVIPCLLLKDQGLVKTVRFAKPRYVGDPINAIRIFNEKEVDELVFLDITASIERRPPPMRLLSEIASECFMPLGYGGGITSVEHARELFRLGVEKVVVNTSAVEHPDLVRGLADLAGSSSVVVSIDVKKGFFGRSEVRIRSGRKGTGLDPVAWAVRMQELGAGELFVNSIDRDGTMEGYDLPLLKRITSAVDIPVIASGGAGSVQDLHKAVHEAGVSAVAAGSLFVFHGPHRAVLINYPTPQDLESLHLWDQPAADV